MATQYTTILKLALPVQGELSGTWGDVVNDNITEMVEEAIAGRKVINTWTANSHTLTTADGTTSESRAAILTLTDTGTALTGAGTVICPANSKVYIVENGAGQTITVKTSSGTGVAVPNGENMVVFCDGTNVEQGITNINDLNITGDFTVVDGNVGIGDTNPVDRLTVSRLGNNWAGVTPNANTTALFHPGTTNSTSGSALTIASNDSSSSSIYFSDSTDNDVGLIAYSHTDDSLRLRVNGTERMRITSAGDVGIGTTAPTFDSGYNGLHINRAAPSIHLTPSSQGTTASDGYAINVNSSGVVRHINKENQAMEFHTNNTERMRITSAGRVGIGTTTPSSKLHVRDTNTIVKSEGTGGYGSFYAIGSGTNSAHLFMGNGGGEKSRITTDDNGSIRFSNTTSATERMRITNTGNVGIGTTSPSYDLSVVGSSAAIQIDNTAGSPDQLLMLFQADTGTYDRNFQIRTPATDSASDSFRFTTSNSFAFDIDAVERLTIAANGRIGISNDTPDAPLDISGASSHLKLTNSSAEGASNTNYNINMASYYAEEAFSIYQGDSYRARTWIGFDNYGGEITFGSAGTQRMVIDNSGYVGIGGVPSGVLLDVIGTTDPSIRVRSTGTGASDDSVIRNLIGGTTASNYIYFGDADDANAGQIRYVHSDDSMRIYAGATTERLRFYSNQTIFYNGTTEIGRFASNNKFGIGTSSPAMNLHVNSTGNTQVKISSSFNGSTTSGLYIDTTGDTSKARLAFQKGGATVGVLGFNHSSSATSEGYSFSTSLGTRALLQGDGLRLYNTSGGVSHFFTYNENGGEIQLLDETGTVGTLIDEVSSASRFLQLINGSVVQVGLGSSNTTGNLQFIGGGSEWARFTSDGRLGIANTNPQAQVHAVADGAYTPAYYAQNDGSAASWARMDFYNNQASNTGIIYRDQGGNFVFRNDNSTGTATTTSIVAGNTTAGHITFNTTVSSEAMRVESSGEVGIGTATPSAKLHVYTISTNNIVKSHSGSGYAAFQAHSSGTNPAYIFFNNASGERGRITVSNSGEMIFYRAGTLENARFMSTGVLRMEKSIAEHSTALSGSGTVQINYRLGNNFTHTLSGNTTYTFVTPEASGYVSAITLKVTQDSTARTITWPSSVDWAGGTAPTLSTGSGDVDIFVFVTYDGGTTYYGFTAGQDMS